MQGSTCGHNRWRRASDAPHTARRLWLAAPEGELVARCAVCCPVCMRCRCCCRLQGGEAAAPPPAAPHGSGPAEPWTGRLCLWQPCGDAGLGSRAAASPPVSRAVCARAFRGVEGAKLQCRKL